MQQRELALMRQYESVLVQRETEALDENLKVNNARSESLARIGRMLRAVLRRLGGEDVDVYEAHTAAAGGRSAGQSRQPSMATDALSARREETSGEGESSQKDKGKARDDGTHNDERRSESPDPDVDRLLEEEDPEKRLAASEWALERESELARLERENEELRALVNGLLKPEVPSSTAPPRPSELSSAAPISIPDHPASDGEARNSDEHPSFATIPRQHRMLGGPPGRVGPFGTYKSATLIPMDSR